MEVIIRETRDKASKLTAALIQQAMELNPDLVLGLATGRTMEGVYALLAEAHEKKGLDFSGVTTFNLDEYGGIPASHPGSYRHYMNTHLFGKVNIDPANTHLPDGMAEDVAAEGQRYENEIQAAGGIDFQLLGIGGTGHIGFNEPLSALRSRTRDKALTPETIRQNAPVFGSAEDMPRWAITMGVGTILECRRCVLLACGEEKAGIVAKAVEGPITSMISATALQLHPNCTIIVDEAAAARLENTEYYRWIFENESQWAPFRD